MLHRSPQNQWQTTLFPTAVDSFKYLSATGNRNSTWITPPNRSKKRLKRQKSCPTGHVSVLFATVPPHASPRQKHNSAAMFSHSSRKSAMIRIRKTCILRPARVYNTFVKMDLQVVRDIWSRDALVQVGSLRIRFNVT